MDFKQFFEVHTNDCGNPTFIADYETEELIYLNQAMEKKFQIFENYIGKTCEQVIPYFQDVRGYQDKSELKVGEFLDNTFLCELLNANLRSKCTLWEIGSRKFFQTKYFLAPTDDRRLEAENLFERAMARCLEILNDNAGDQSIEALLELLGQFYACELSYICEFDRQTQGLSKYHLWSSHSVVHELPLVKDGFSLDSFVKWLDRDHKKSVINLDSQLHDYDIDSIEDQLLQQYNLQNITVSKLWSKEGELMGIVGLSNRAESMYDDRLLQAVSHFVMEQFSQNSMVEALEDLNDIDLLTGFYNRSKYVERLEDLEKNRPESLGVLFVNLNGLRTTNQYLGYEAGDEQLKKTATILNEYFNSNFYRVTGDEFVGFVPNCDLDIFEETVDSLQNRLKAHHHEATFSFGHSWEKGRYSVPDLIKIADTVMVINKQSYYHESLKDTDKITNSMLQDLFRAIAEDEFLVYLQPQIDLSTEKVVGAEALIRRWDSRSNKMIFPDVFIPLYEKNSVIRHVDLFVLRKVCQIMKNWIQVGQELPISVNLSRVTLMEHGIVKTINDILDEYQIPHHLVVIEITERVGLIENDVAVSLVEEFKANDYKLSLDDFGCTYSNIVTLAQIEVDEVKIDKSLVDKLISNPKNRVIVKNMLLMCHELENTFTLAEGIETQEQANYLRSVHCHLGQGYLYARPMPNEEFFDKYIKVG